ncbi:formylglycine-generating enzyme family protein [Myxococcota bacterium]|nr:formylglycine-generating enzyme family protein [Myxococcota bacterium]
MLRARTFLRAALAIAALSTGCADDSPLETPDKEVCLTRRDGQSYCIDVYEASRRDATETSAGADDASPPRSLDGRMPWTNVTWAAAKTACASKNKRLCERDEWIDACDGIVGEAEGSRYTYGDTLEPTLCNTSGAGVGATGATRTCRSVVGTFDQSGNVWEWTGTSAPVAAARGGGYRSDVVHECKSGEGVQLFDPTQPSPEVGFRCCRD